MHRAVLRYVREVARQGSVRKAAQVLNVASPALNRQILKLEEELGTRLFDRLPDGMRPTEAGETLLRHVRDTLNDYDRTVSEINALQGVSTGTVRIVTLDSLMVGVLPAMVTAFCRAYPAVAVSVLARPPVAMFDEVLAAEADIALSFTSPLPPSLRQVASMKLPMGAVMTPDHPLAGRKSLNFQDFAEHLVLLQKDALPALSFFEDEFAAFRDAIRPRVVANNIDFLKRMLLAGLGVAFYTRLGFLNEIASGQVVWIPLAVHRLQRLRLSLVVPANRKLAPAAAALVEQIAARMSELERSA